MRLVLDGIEFYRDILYYLLFLCVKMCGFVGFCGVSFCINCFENCIGRSLSFLDKCLVFFDKCGFVRVCC